MTNKPFILGHEKQRKLLSDVLVADHLPSALLFAGTTGIGKALVARELAQTLFCDTFNHKHSTDSDEQLLYGGCGECHACHLFSVGNMPDFYQVECLDRDNWNIQRIRELLYSLHLKAFSGRNRVILFNDAEHMSEQAANALLKALEEPRPNTYFLLITSGYSKLPSTITSRCQVWYFDSLPDKVVLELLHRKADWVSENIDTTTISYEELVSLADGSIGELEKIIKFVDSWAEVKDKLDRICSDQPEIAASFAQELGKNRDKLRVILHLLRIRGRAKMLESTSPQARCAWADFLTNLITAERLIFERNLSASYVLHFIFMTVASVITPGSYFDIDTNKRLLEHVVVR